VSKPATTDTGFFIPNLCSRRSVFLLTLFSQLLALVLVLAIYQEGPFPWQDHLLTSLLVLWITFCIAAVLCVFKNRMQQLTPAVAGFSCWLIILFISAIFAMLADRLLPKTSHEDINSIFIFKTMAISGIIGGLILRYFYLVAELEAQRRAELLHRLQALQSQIHPHFLFNSMNILASLISSDAKKAEQVVEDLADLFRASLKPLGQPVPLKQEIQLCRHYLNIEMLRLGPRLLVEWQLPEKIPHQLSIPILTLQPLVENAIGHGIALLNEGGILKIKVELLAQHIRIRITNPLPATAIIHDKKASSNNLALQNITHRLTALYGQDVRLTTEVSEGYFTLTLIYPNVQLANTRD
jgi:two-component system sensor histidine kinase AlgZ